MHVYHTLVDCVENGFCFPGVFLNFFQLAHRKLELGKVKNLKPLINSKYFISKENSKFARKIVKNIHPEPFQ